MMRRKLLRFNKKTTYFFCIILCCFSMSCKSQINILSDDITIVQPSFQISNSQLNEIIEILLNEESMANWKYRTKKMLIVSATTKSNDTIVRIIPKVREKHSIGQIDLSNTYSSYLMYKDIFVVYWGDEKFFFKPVKSTFIKDFFEINKEDSEQPILPRINNNEFYGYEFLIKNKKVSLIKEDFFASPIIN